MKYIDLTYTVVDNMPVFPGDPAMALKQVAAIEKNGYTDHQLSTYMHVGTHMDAPLHMIENGAYMSEIPVGQFTGPGILVDARGKQTIDARVLNGKKMQRGSIVLLFTGYDKKYRTPEYDSGYPKISMDFAEQLVNSKIKILGMDMVNPDTEETFPIHKKLLSHSTLIIENLTNLGKLLNVHSFDVFAFPMNIRADAAPVRVVARIP